MSFTTTCKHQPSTVPATLARRIEQWLQRETRGAITRKKTILAQALIAAIVATPLTALASEAELLQRIEKLAAELEKVKAELLANRQKTETVEKRQDALAATAPVSSPSVSNVAVGPQTVITGYGEVNYTRPAKDPSQAQADVRRAVIGIQHRFDDKTKLVTEFEWEHAVTSRDDAGEAEVEQLYIEHEFNSGLRAKAGLFLIPAGLLNTSHEPTAYYGVERNFVETAIIPSTWREAGLGLSSTLDNGLTWDLGLTTGFDLTKWDATSTGGRESPLGSIHQEGQLAKARNLSVHGALNWRGVPGLLLGGSIFTGKASHSTADFAAPDARVTLADLHARYTPGKWDLSAVYAHGTISNTDALNASFANPDPTVTVTPVPSVFSGWYAQAAYKVWKSGDYALTPFVRYETFNTTKSISGLDVPAAPDEKVVTLGASLKVSEGVVLKADYQKFKEDTTRDRLNLGVGFSF
jgi:Phosphate-selective porin O and P